MTIGVISERDGLATNDTDLANCADDHGLGGFLGDTWKRYFVDR